MLKDMRQSLDKLTLSVRSLEMRESGDDTERSAAGLPFFLDQLIIL